MQKIFKSFLLFVKIMIYDITEKILGGNIQCGNIVAIPYFFSFIIIANMMFLQFFTVIVASAIDEAYVVNLDELQKIHLDKFINKWCHFDKQVKKNYIFIFKII